MSHFWDFKTLAGKSIRLTQTHSRALRACIIRILPFSMLHRVDYWFTFGYCSWYASWRVSVLPNPMPAYIMTDADIQRVEAQHVKSPSHPRQLILLTDGHTNPLTAKTATSVLRYCRDEVVALFERSQVGKSAHELLGVGEGVPVVGELAAVPEANGLMIGIAPPGGRIPESWRPIILEAIARKMTI
jgi:hypothetical protein